MNRKVTPACENQRKQTERLQIPRKSVEIIVGLSGKMAVI